MADPIFNKMNTLMAKPAFWLGIAVTAGVAVLMGWLSVMYGGWIDDKPIRIVLLPAVTLLLFLLFANKTALFLILILIRGPIDPFLEATRYGPLSVGAVMNALVILIVLWFYVEKPRAVAGIVIPMWLPLVLIMAFQTARAPELMQGVRTFLGYMTSIAVFTVPFYLRQCQKDMRFSIMLILVSSIVPAIFGVVDFAHGGQGGELRGRIQSTFPHPNIFACYLVVVISLAFYLVKGKVITISSKLRWLLMGYICILLVELLLTGTRSAWAACIAVFLAYAIIFERRYFVYMGVLGMLALIVPGIQDRILDLDTAKSYWNWGQPQNSYEWRKLLWQSAWDWMQPSAMPLGYGLGSFPYYVTEFFPWSYGIHSNAHSVYYQWLFEAGIVGLACAAWLYFRLVLLIWTGARHDLLGTIIVLSIVLQYLVVAYSDNMLDYLGFNWYYWFIVGTACSIAAARRRESAAQGTALRTPTVSGGASASASTVALCVVACAAVLGLGSSQVLAQPTTSGAAQRVDALPTDSIFAPTSFWYATIPADVPLHPNSAGFVADFLRQKKKFYGTVSINLESWSSPVYVVKPDAPVKRIAQWLCMPQFGADVGLAKQWAEVPWPDYAQPASGSDSEMTIYQPSTDTIWEFWLARKSGGQWEACWGGRMERASKSDGTWPAHYGTTAAGLPFLGGQITAEELRRGEIRHAIGISLVEIEAANVVSWPARRSDGVNPAGEPNRIPEGLRLRLDPKVDVDALAMHPVGKTIAKAAQKYGFIVWDKSGGIGIRSQNPKTYTTVGQPDPYVALFAGTPPHGILNGFPWEKLQFLPKDYGKPR